MSTTAGSVQILPGVRAIEMTDKHRLQKTGIEVAQIHPVPLVGITRQRFPMSGATTCPAANKPKGLVAPDVAVREFGMPLNQYRAELVVRPHRAEPMADRAVAARGLVRSEWQRESHLSAMT